MQEYQGSPESSLPTGKTISMYETILIGTDTVTF